MSDQEGSQRSIPLYWIQKQIQSGTNPREIIARVFGEDTSIPDDFSDLALWRILASLVTELPRRQKLPHINNIEDVVRLLQTCKNIVVLTGAGVSVSCGIPDFRSSNGIYSRLAKDFPSLPNPQAMFDINYFAQDPRPFYKFAREMYPGQFRPSLCHRFIKMLETKGKLLRNYTQNIDTLEQVAGIQNIIECHGSFATASCTKCKYKTDSEAIQEDIFNQKIPICPKCNPLGLVEDFEYNDYSELVEKGIMKPDIVFFGEGLPDAFHDTLDIDKDKCDLLIVIGSSLKVHPVALIPRSIPVDVPQILINREQLHLFTFDVELLGDADATIAKLCQMLGDDYTSLINEQQQSATVNFQSLKTAAQNGMFHNNDISECSQNQEAT